VEFHVFDFDGTLFRYPDPPSWWEREGHLRDDWFVLPQSLDRPCVPNRPDSSWWIEDTIQDAWESISNPNTYPILLTGREDHIFRDRVEELLSQQGLDFEEVHLCTIPNKLGFKLSLLRELLGTSYDTVRFWDDNPDHLREFRQVVSKSGRTVHTKLVSVERHSPLCG